MTDDNIKCIIICFLKSWFTRITGKPEINQLKKIYQMQIKTREEDSVVVWLVVFMNNSSQ